MKKLLHLTSLSSVKTICCTTLIISFSFYTHAQEMAVRIYTAKDGLPSSNIYGAYQDKTGYLWIGSHEGISRFDGSNFINYGLADGLPDTRAGLMLIDSRLRYWITTPKNVVQYKANKFFTYPFSDTVNIRWLFQIIETKSTNIWALTDAGVYQFSLNKWNKIKLYPGYENHACRNIIETSEGIYINYGNLLVLLKPDNTYKIIGPFKESAYYYNTLAISTGQIFISTLDGIFQIKNQQLVKLSGVLGKLKGLYVYFQDSKKRFWIGRFNIGMQLLDKDDSSHLITVYDGPTNFLPQRISEDNNGNIWVGSGNGLIKISEREFKNFNLPSIIGNTIIRNVLQPSDGPMLINNGSMTFYTFDNGIFSTKKTINKGNSPLPNNELIIDNYAFDNKGRYWYYIRGFSLAMQQDNKVYEQSKNLSHLGDEVFDVLFDRYRKKIIIAVKNQKSPCQFNNTSYSLLTLANDIEVKGEIRRLHQCVNGTILLATDKGFVYSIDKQNSCKLQLNEFGVQGIISWFYNDPAGNVWIIYAGKGLRCYYWQNDSLIFREQLTEANGLPNDNVSSLCFDNEDNLWGCTSSGVVVFSKNNTSSNQTYRLIGFFTTKDLQIDGPVDARMTKDNKGNIWYFSGTHLICFYPGKIKYNFPAPSIVIENIELNLRQTDWAVYADSLSGLFQLPYRLKLSHNNNTFGIYFKGISSSGTEGIKYSYQLLGLDDLWSKPSSNDFVSFIKLLPGKYTFKVKAQLPNTSWSEPAVFSFEIKKAFWQTWWFYILVGIVLSSAIYTLFRYRLQQKINLLEIRNRFSRDLHDEIGSSVSGINLLSQMAAEKLDSNKPEEASAYLTKVKNYSQDVIEKLSDMVWVFNPQNDSIEKLLQRLKSFAVSIAQSKNITLHFETDNENKIRHLTIRQRKAIYLISKEALNNIFKYATCNNIYYSLFANGAKWKLQIKDDGIGFLSCEITNGNGLNNMLARAKEIGGNINIQSQPGKGTIVTLEF
jgi:ligand-binding sensor domain-containing protein/two-component sensor histidine kinase